MALTNRQHSDADTLFRYFFSEGYLQPERVPPKRKRLLERVSRNSNMIDFHKNSSQ